MMPAPQTIAADLCNTLLHLVEDDAKLSQFERHKYASQAEKLKRADPAGREAALMLLAVLNGDPAACVEHGERLLELRGDEVDYLNFSLSLLDLGQIQQQFSALQRGVAKYPQATMLLDELICTAMAMEEADVLEKALSEWELLTGTPHILVFDAALQEMGEEESLSVLSEMLQHSKDNLHAPATGKLQRMRKLADEIES